MYKIIAIIAAVILPLWNIPLIVRMVKRKSSQDISIFWAAGVWVCLVLMAPAGFNSVDIVWRVFSIINFIFFSAVMLTVMIYRKGKNHG